MHPCLTCLCACCPGPFDGFYKVCRLLESMQQEGELGKLQGLGCRDCGEDKSRGRRWSEQNGEGSEGLGLGGLPQDSLRRFSPVVSYLSCSHSGGGG